MKFIKYSMISVSILAVCVLFFIVLTIEKPVRVKLEAYYMAYACNDCGPNYRIKKILKGGEYIKGKTTKRDVRVEFRSHALEDSIDKATGHCAICYEHIFYGDFYYQPKKDFSLLKVDSSSFSLRKDCCSDSPPNKKTNTH